MIRRKPNLSHKNRPTFALLVDTISHEYEINLMTGAADAAREHDINLVCYIAGVSGQYADRQFDMLYKLIDEVIDPELCDGLILTNTFLGLHKSDFFSEFMTRYRDVPMVSAAPIDPRIPHISVDNRQAMRKVLIHLVERHHCRRLAIIRGPVQQQEAEERYQAYCEVLAEYGLPMDPALVLPGIFTRISGADAIVELLKRGGELPDAIVACNDPMAIGAIQALQAAGLRVPEDVIVTGFDDTDEALAIDPEVTTVRQPLYEQGKWAVEALLARVVDGSPARNDVVTLAPTLVVRHSCGCSWFSSPGGAPAPPLADDAEPGPRAGRPAGLPPIGGSLSEMITQVEGVATQAGLHLPHDSYVRLATAFLDSLQSAPPTRYFAALSEQFQHFAPIGEHIYVWQAANAALQECVLAVIHDPEPRRRAEMLFQGAKRVLSEAEVHRLVQRESRLKSYFVASHDIERMLATTKSFDELADVIVREVPRLHARSCYVGVFPRDEQDSRPKLQIFGYNRANAIRPQECELSPTAKGLLPPDLLAAHDRFSFLVAPILMDDHLVGYITVEMERYQDWIYEIVSDQLGRAVKQILMVQDRDRLLADLEKRATALEQATHAKLVAEASAEAKAVFLANMSHEIRTPLNAIIGMTGLLLDSSLTQEQSDFAEIVRSSGDTLLTLVNDILDFSKIDSGKMDLEMIPFDLLTCVEDALDLFRVEANRKGLELAYSFSPDTPQNIIGDPSRVRQILVNLVSNAIKFTEQGEVVVTVDSQPEHDHYNLHFAVRDTGVGILPEDVTRLFASFSQVDASTTRRYGGTGLGLAISRRLAEMMGGRMWVESAFNAGSTFQFTLLAQAAEFESRVRTITPRGLMDKRVLVVDDHPISVEILVRQLSGWGMLPTAVHSGAAGLDAVLADRPFDLAILDWHMPEIDGLTLAAKFRQIPQGAQLPLVMLSSIDYSVEEARQLHFSAMLAKPVKQEQLKKTLLQILGQESSVPRKTLAAPRYDSTMAQQVPLRILVAEDNVVNQKVAVHMLAHLGYRVDVVANGLEALEAVDRQPYDVILMDVQMPELDGLEATRRLCSRLPLRQRPYIVAMTASALMGDDQKCLDAGMDDYISKPVRVEKLVAALASSRRPISNDDEDRVAGPSKMTVSS